ncbi:16S rRNA (guanine(527)-N(7))-methyltransferase RsmG [Sphingomonas koreensis]|nr:16S rRNA (guanine(527)-N(7))-methyltransferase RsmG [Sphingomonas koreensis]
MTEEEARRWIGAHWGVSRETRLDALATLVSIEAANQNLIAASTIPEIWSRHILDSAQLLQSVDPADTSNWLDIGTGAGFPGLVIACLRDLSITLAEPRRRRVEFLESAISHLGIGGHTSIAPVKVQHVDGHFGIISARAVAPMPQLFDAAAHLSDRKTIWLLPKGKSAREEVATARKSWHGSFHVEQSLTNPDALIVVATGVARR